MPRLFVYEMVIHWIDGARYLMGDVDRVYARVARINPVIAGEDAAVLILSHGRATTLLDGSWASPEKTPRPLGDGGVVLEGRDGSLHFDPSAGELRRITTDGTSLLERYPPPPRSVHAAFNNCIADFAAGVRWGRPFVSSAEDNLRTLAVTLAAYDSAATGNAVTPELV